MATREELENLYKLGKKDGQIEMFNELEGIYKNNIDDSSENLLSKISLHLMKIHYKLSKEKSNEMSNL